LTTREVKAREERIISFAELEEAIDRPIRTYSSGMYLRLAFAAAIEFEPSILVLDEVLAVGDERFQKKCLERITHLKQEGTTLIITSHSAEEIQLLCEDVLVLEEGQVAMQGDPKSALACYHDLLRQRTEKRVAQLSGQSSISSAVITEQGNRQGTQEASISKVRVYDLNGNETGSIRNSESLVIELEYQLAAPLPDFAVTLGVFTGTEVKCFETSLASVKSLCSTLPSQGTIRCEFNSLPLLTGSYFINVGVYPTDWGYMYDYHWQMHSIHIVDEKSERRWDSGWDPWASHQSAVSSQRLP
jgi:lipopolysaccharide transport system ATP-binding protein